MPPRGKRAAQTAPAVEEVEETEVDENPFDHHLTKDLSATMSDYADWFHENVTDIDDLGKTDPARLLALGSTLYPHFQRSPLNQERRAARKAERQSAEPAEEAEAAPAPARRGRGAATAPAATKAPATAKAGRGRGKPATKVEAY
jgi:hypothetical protein